MKNEGYVTNRELFEAILDIRDKMDEIVDKRISPLEKAVDKMGVYFSIAITALGVIISLSVAWIKRELHL